MTIRTFLLALTVLTSAAPLSAQPTHPSHPAPYHLPGATERTITAPDGDTYRVFVAKPDQPAPDGGYPLLYVLDGDDNFPIAVATARRLVRAGARSGVEPGIIVAIDSGPLARRARDYTPRITGEAIRQGQPGHGLPTGGGDAFLAFLTGTVHPAIATDTPINPKRIAIVGHSFGGLLALHAFATRPDFFSTAIAASPSLWLGDGQLLANGALLPKAAQAKGQRLLLTVGEQESGGTAGADPAAAVGENSWSNLTRYRDAVAARGAQVTLRQLSGESHGTTMAPTLTDAVRAAFLKPPAPTAPGKP